MLGAVARVLGMDLSEAERPLREYRSVDELFVRRLRREARRWPSDASVAASPVDGVVGQTGRTRDGRVLQAKGREYAVAELLDDLELGERFRGGSFVTLYLAPRHYHRIHAPVSGLLRRARHVPGRLLPVNAPAVGLVDRLFPRNERLVAVLEPSDAEETTGAVAVVAVGAFNVGRISADFDADLVTNRRGARAETRLYHPPVEIRRGDPLMAFHLGSTVVLLFERPVPLAPHLRPAAPIRLGAELTGADRPAP